MGESEHPAAITDEVERLRGERDALRAERDSLHAQLSAVHERRRNRAVLRRAAVGVMTALACVSLTTATVGAWANRTLLTTSGWVETIGPLGEDPAVAAALRPRITDAVFTAIPAQELIAEALPEDRAFLAIPLSSAIRGFVDDRVGTFLASDRFAELWVEANEVAHRRALAVLRGDSEAVQVDGETVTLNLLPVINNVLAELNQVASGLVGTDVALPAITSGEVPDRARARINDALGVELPEDVGQIPVYDAAELIVAQEALRLFDQTLVPLFVATMVFVVGAVWLSRRRRGTVVSLALGSVLLLVFVRRVVLRFQEQIVAMPPQPEGRVAAEAVMDQVRGGLFNLTAVVIAIALAIIVIALLSGPYRWAMALRRGAVQLCRAVWNAGGRQPIGTDTRGVVGWMAARRHALQIGGALLAVALLLAVDVPWGWFLTTVALLVCWEIALWRLGDRLPPDTAPVSQ